MRVERGGCALGAGIGEKGVERQARQCRAGRRDIQREKGGAREREELPPSAARAQTSPPLAVWCWVPEKEEGRSIQYRP